MQQIYGAKASVLTWGGLADILGITRNQCSDVRALTARSQQRS